MKTIKGIFDGKKIIPLEELPKTKKYKVLITFIEELNEKDKIRNYTSASDAFTFWEESAEDIYQDYIPKKKK